MPSIFDDYIGFMELELKQDLITGYKNQTSLLITNLDEAGVKTYYLKENDSVFNIVTAFLQQCRRDDLNELFQVFRKLSEFCPGLTSLKKAKEILEKATSPRVQWMLELSCHFDEIDDQKLNAIINHCQQISGDLSLTLKKKERGSIKLTFEGSQEGMEKIKALFESGELTAILEIPIKNISLVTQVSPPTEIINEPTWRNKAKAPQIFIAHASEDKPKVEDEVLDTPEEIPDNAPQTKSPALDKKYKKLEYCLVHQQLEEADQETVRLIIKATRRRHISFLQADDFKNFDCSVLKQIDQLWRKFSNDKFGFTIQRKIWKDIGGKPGQYKFSDFMEFCDCVGWRNS